MRVIADVTTATVPLFLSCIWRAVRKALVNHKASAYGAFSHANFWRNFRCTFWCKLHQNCIPTVCNRLYFHYVFLVLLRMHPFQGCTFIALCLVGTGAGFTRPAGSNNIPLGFSAAMVKASFALLFIAMMLGIALAIAGVLVILNSFARLAPLVSHSTAVERLLHSIYY